MRGTVVIFLPLAVAWPTTLGPRNKFHPKSLRENVWGTRLLIGAWLPGLIFVAGEHKKSPCGNTRGTAFINLWSLGLPSLWPMASDHPQVSARKHGGPQRYFSSAAPGHPASSS